MLKQDSVTILKKYICLGTFQSLHLSRDFQALISAWKTAMSAQTWNLMFKSNVESLKNNGLKIH